MKKIITTEPIPATPGMKIVYDHITGTDKGIIVSSDKKDNKITIKITEKYGLYPINTIVNVNANWVHPRENWNPRKMTVIPVNWELA
jgi:hypothetical protein